MVDNCIICMKEPACYRFKGKMQGSFNGEFSKGNLQMLIGGKCYVKLLQNGKDFESRIKEERIENGNKN